MQRISPQNKAFAAAAVMLVAGLLGVVGAIGEWVQLVGFGVAALIALAGVDLRQEIRLRRGHDASR